MANGEIEFNDENIANSNKLTNKNKINFESIENGLLKTGNKISNDIAANLDKYSVSVSTIMSNGSLVVNNMDCDKSEPSLDDISSASLDITLEDVFKGKKQKKKMRSRLERELETNLTPKITSMCSESSVSPDTPLNTSRYGRARKQKTIVDFYPTDSISFSIPKKSPKKSPPFKPSPSAKKTSNVSLITHSKTPVKCYPSPNGNASSPSVESKVINTPWNESSSVRSQMKVYVRKDLIQRKKEEKEETGSIMRNMFSPPKASPNGSFNEASPIKSVKKKATPETKTKKSLTLNPKKNSVVKVLKMDANRDVKIETQDHPVISPKLLKDIGSVEIEPPVVIEYKMSQEEMLCSWKLGDLAWARVGSHPMWPCLITRDPMCSLFVRKKTVGRSMMATDVLHVTFFADSGRRSWLISNCLMIFTGLEDFIQTRDNLTAELKKKDPKYCASFIVSQNKKSKWLSAVSEAEMLLRRPPELREQFFINMFLSPQYVVKKEYKPKKEKKLKDTAEPNMTLSESLFDSLFADSDGADLKVEKEKNSPKKNVVELMSACLDNMAAESGNEKIITMTQSHMDRWLLKAKQPTMVATSDETKIIKVKVKKPSKSASNGNVQNVDSSEVEEVIEAKETSTRFKKRRLSSGGSATKKKASKLSLNLSAKSVDDSDKETKTDKEITIEEDNTEEDITEKNNEDGKEDSKGDSKDVEENEKTDTDVNPNLESVALDGADVAENNASVCNDTSIADDIQDEEIKKSPLPIVETSTPNSRRMRSKISRNDSDWSYNIVYSHDTDSSVEDSDTDSEETAVSTKNKPNPKYDDPDFRQFVELKKDTLMDENPDLTEEDIMPYLYKTWQYGESSKTDSEKMKNNEDFCLVKGMVEDIPVAPPKKQRKKVIKDDGKVPTSPVTPRERHLRQKSIKACFNDSDLSDFERDDVIKSPKRKSPVDPSASLDNANLENGSVSTVSDVKYAKKISKQNKAVTYQEVGEEPPLVVDHFMAALTVPKPNIFKGLVKEKVCEICECPGNLLKCRGPCGVMFHKACVQKQAEPSSTDQGSVVKRRKKRGRKSGTQIKKKVQSIEHDNDLSAHVSDCGSADDSQPTADDTISDSINQDNNVQNESETPKKECCVLKLFNEEVEIPSPSPSTTKSKDSEKDESGSKNQGPELLDESTSNSVCSIHLVANAIDFESQLAAKMQEMIDNCEVSQDLDISSASSTEGDCDWESTQAGDCLIIDHKRKLKPKVEPPYEPPVNVLSESENFKCNDCQRYEMPPCFVCKSITSPKKNELERQRCNVIHCNKFFHLECLGLWPQTKYSTGAPSKSSKKPASEALTCPRHVCHTCVSDDPHGCKTRFSGDKLARCVRCPATYHSFTQCVPAGTVILTASQIICPKHCITKPGKTHVNTSWCFICAKGGSLICCETCPTSFHAECLNILPPEGGYTCEDCETGRLPLYGELVWVKLGQYRWWPALVLHPMEVPPNIAALPHQPGQFAVRFFGGYDHYWVNSGRVFPYQEGDTGHASSKKSSVDHSFMLAIKQAQEACAIIKNLKQSSVDEGELLSSLLPPQYIKLKINRAVGGATLGAKANNGEGGANRCDCDPNAARPCAPDTDCLNRMLLTECNPTVCASGERCLNQAFEKRLYPHLAPSRTQHRGWGLKALSDVRKGEFVIEYVGEVIDETEFQRRMARRQETRDENYYFLTLDKDRMIDAGPKGNVARFMNHSCEPNCETQKWTVNGDIRVGLFALKDIPADTEVTFNYNLACAGDDKKRCLCGAKRCGGFIGAKPKQDDPVPKKPKKVQLKRRYKRKAIVATSAAAGTSKQKTRISSESKKPPPPPKVETIGIYNDLELINRAVADVELREHCEKTDKSEIIKVEILKSESIEDRIKCEIKPEILNGTLDCAKINHSVVLNGTSPTEDDKSMKRKRTSLVSPKTEDSKSALPSNGSRVKRARSSSVHFSNSVTYIGEEDVTVCDEPMSVTPVAEQNGHSDVNEDCVSADDADSLDAKKVRGRPKKSGVVTEI